METGQTIFSLMEHVSKTQIGVKLGRKCNLLLVLTVLVYLELGCSTIPIPGTSFV